MDYLKHGIWYANKFYYNEKTFWSGVSYAFLSGSLVGGSIIHLLMMRVF